MNLEIQVRPVAGDPLVDDYVAQAPDLLSFFAGSPFAATAFRARAAEVRARFDPDSLLAMAGAVTPLSPGARERLDAIARGEGFFVTTGQQPGLFGGPLYTLHKALAAMSLAERIERLLEVPVLPLFWIASDDHDWEEANHTYLLDTSNEPHRVQLDGPEAPPLSMGRRPVGPSGEAALDELAELLPPSDFKSDLVAALQQAYEAQATVAGAFTATLRSWFDGLDLGLVDSRHEAVRRLGAPVIRRELENHAGHETALRDATVRLEALGYTAQVPVLEGATNVFHEDSEHGRERIMREGGDWVLRSSRRRFSESELSTLLETAEDRFSPNVVLRPVVESTVFPTLAYVAGPGEVRYLAQTGGLFAAHGVGMPLVVPRLSVTLVEKKVAKVLDKFELDVAAFGRPIHELIAAAVRDDVPAAVQAALAALREAAQEGYQRLFDAAKAVDPTLKGPIFSARNDALRALGDVEKKVRQHVKLREETELEQLSKAATNLAPLGKPQERVLNAHQYLARYGPALVTAIRDAMAERWQGLVRDEAPAKAGAGGSGDED